MTFSRYTRIARIALPAAAVAFAGGLAAGPGLSWLQANAPQLVPSAFAQEGRQETYRLLNLFGDVFERVRAEYVEPVNDRDLIEAAINGMLTSLDPHSGYMNQRTFRDMQVQTRGEFGGLGIEVTAEGGYIRVISPIDDTPAARAGVKPGDLITHIDGTSTQGLTLNEAVEKMRGAPRTDIKLTIRRQDVQTPIELTLTRDVIRIQSVRYRTERDVGYIRITSFSEQTDRGLRNAIEQIKKQLGNRLQGYVIDLRNNPGGLLDQAVAVTSDFLNQGEVVSTRARRSEDAQRFNSRGPDITDGAPLVVLINGGSASASEIVAGALQDHRRAVLLGTKSFGKGSVQTVMPLQGNGAIRLTTARYYTPSGRSIQATGIEPDIIVEPARIESVAEGARGREADLRGALRNDGGIRGQRPAPTDQPPSANPPEGMAPTAPQAGAPGANDPSQDYQLQRALDLVRGLALMRRAAN
jgi:carboxyl-terminal processing protease